MADKSKEKKQEKADKKAAKKEAKEAKKKAKAAAKLEKKNKKESSGKPDKDDTPDKSEKSSKKKNFLTVKNLVIFSVLVLILAGSSFFVYKTYFSTSDEPIEYKSVVLKNINLPDEMLKFSFYQINDLYFALVTYDLRVFLFDKEISRINQIGENYPEQKNIADKEKKNWIKAKEKVEKTFIKIEKAIKEIYVLYNVNKNEGEQKIKEKSEELLNRATDALKTLDPYIQKIEKNKVKAPQGFINKIIYKIKNIF